MQTHGRINEIVEFAEKKKAYETIITHYINGGLYNKAIDQLEQIPESETKRFREILFKQCHILMKQAPDITFKMLTKKLKEKDGFPF